MSFTQPHELKSSNKLVRFSEDLCKFKVISTEVKDVFARLDRDRLDSKLKVRYLMQQVREGVKFDVTVFERFLKVLAGLGGNAERVSRRVCKELGVSERDVAAKDPGLDSSLTIACQSIDTEVADGKSTLLEVHISSNEGLSYQWMKDGQPLSYEQTYLSACTDILVISVARQGVGGSYTCRISKGGEEVISAVIVLTVSFPCEKELLLKLYAKRREIAKDSWPPVGTSTFINLALINKNKLGTGDYNYSVRGDVDDILGSKEKIEYEEVFGKYESGALVLVEGRPGSGKTTLVRKVTRDWATRGDVLKNARMVFLIPLRSLVNRKDESLSDVLGIFYRAKAQREKLLDDIERSHGEGICFILDGLDEYQTQDESNSVIYQLLQGTYLPAAMVIVSSRPVAVNSLGDETTVTRQIEVLGFTRQQIFDYIDKYPFSLDASKTLASKLKAYLNSHLNVLHMCYLPVHAAMICFLCQHEKGEIPRTDTQVYESFSRFIVLRKLRRSNRKAQLHSLNDLRGKNEQYFRRICHLAFDMTIQSKQVLQQRDAEVSLSFGSDPDDSPSLGLVTIDSTAKLYGLDNTYAFLHLTFQEYLAAFYMANLEEEQQIEMIRLHAGKKQMRMVWRFYCGMVKFKDKVPQIQQIMRSAANSLGKVLCAFESQQCVVCDSILDFCGVLNFRQCTLTPADLNAIGYVISNTSHPVVELLMSGCDLNGDKVQIFFGEVNDKLKSIQTLDLSHNSIGPDGAVALAGGLKSSNNLQALYLSVNKFGADGAAALADGLQSFYNLQVLDLSDNNIGSEGVIILSDKLRSCNNLQALYLPHNDIGCDGAEALVNVLKLCGNLQTLDISYNKVGSDGLAALAVGLKFCNNLQALYLLHNNIGVDGTTALAHGLKSCDNLQALHLSDKSIGTDGASALAVGIKSCNKLQSLYLTHSNIGSDGVTALANALESCQDLQTLYLTDNEIGEHGAAALAVGLKSCKHLQKLVIPYNDIGTGGATALANELGACNNLQALYLSHNNIGPSGAAALANLKCSIIRYD